MKQRDTKSYISNLAMIDGEIRNSNTRFDKRKSQINKKKHGIDFVEAQILWYDPDRVEIPAKTIDEERFVIMGKIADKFWSTIITYRNEKVRIISVRRSRKEEIEIYES